MNSTARGTAFPCTVRSCPHGCSVLTLGAFSVHVSSADFANLVTLLLTHARSTGIEVPAEMPPAALPAFN